MPGPEILKTYAIIKRAFVIEFFYHNEIDIYSDVWVTHPNLGI